MIKVRPGCDLSLYYKGYSNQNMHIINTFVYHTDSSLFLKYKIPNLGFGSNRDLYLPELVEIKFNDIVAFRKIGPGLSITEGLLKTGTTIASIILLNRLYSESSVTPLQKIGITFGAGIAISLGFKAIFRSAPKYQMQNNWIILALKSQ